MSGIKYLLFCEVVILGKNCTCAFNDNVLLTTVPLFPAFWVYLCSSKLLPGSSVWFGLSAPEKAGPAGLHGTYWGYFCATKNAALNKQICV